MSVTVRIPTVLQKLSAGRDRLDAAGNTVAEVFDTLRTTHGDLVHRITTEEGNVKPFLNIFVNGADIRFENDIQTRVREGDEISIVPSIAGG